jgi:hypothetical protein
MSGPVTPMLILTGISFGNQWYNTGSVDLKILVEGGIATAVLALVGSAPGMAPVTGAIAWLALVAVSIAPVQSPTPVQNLLKITGG